MNAKLAKLDEAIRLCGHAINANNGACQVIEEALLAAMSLLLDMYNALGENSNVIVAEVSKTWPDPGADSDVLARRFEEVIRFNALRGFELANWRLVVTAMPDQGLNETIVAVFKRVK
jgi:hypothetical protein